MRAGTLASVLVAGLIAYSAGCYEDSVVGTSGKRSAKVTDPASTSMPKTQSRIKAKPGENIALANPFLGDIDGDGLDDFLISAIVANPLGTSGDDTVSYLYYGRDGFPAQLSTTDADAVFQTNTLASGPIGDIDGDGLADFALARFDASEIVFGSRHRLQGTYMPFSIGTRWEQPTLPAPFSPRAVQMNMRGVGDFDGDSADDLIVTGAKIVSDEEIEHGDAPFGLRTRSYLVPGHTGEWPSATWDMSQAIAEFGTKIVEADNETYTLTLEPIALGDLDGDGLADVGAHAEDGLLIFYGGRERKGVIGPEQADAHLLLKDEQVIAIGDADNDGANDLVGLSSSNAAIDVYYGRRWSGERKVQPDLELQIEHGNMYATLAASAGDIDGDGWAEIVVASMLFVAGSEEVLDRTSPSGSMYVLRGTGDRQTGQRVLDRSDLLRGAPERWTPPLGEASGFGWTLSMNGDVDGDGGFDILTSSIEHSTVDPPASAAYLIPSTPRTPD